MSSTHDESVDAVFEAAAQLMTSPDVKGQVQMSDKQKLQFYALFQQARNGDCDSLQPSVLDIRERAKWNAWAALSGWTKDDAMRRYVDLVVEVVSDAVPDAAASLSRRLTALSNGVGPITPVSSQPSSPTRSGLRLVVDPIAVDVTAPVQEDDEGAGPVWSSTPRRTAPDGLGLRFISSAVRNGGVGGGSAPPLRRADVMDVIRSLQTELDATTNRVRELEFRTRAASPPPVEAPSGALGLSSAQLALVVLWPIAVTAAWEFVRQRRAAGRR